MKIRVDNIKNYKEINALSGKYRLRQDGIAYIYCGRPSSLGNPFPVTTDTPTEVAIAEFRKHLWNEIKAYQNGTKSSTLVDEILSLAQLCVAEQFLDGSPMKEMVLLCYCYPKQCHATVIANCIKWMIEESSFIYAAVEEVEEQTEDEYEEENYGDYGYYAGDYPDDNGTIELY
ncbi:DUF4326 domain-containing protein [Okeania sp. SIO2B9]|uniref:DUF4326 domain-containing protein n=1 Tax=Okeania sp. SIO2B9 TaxID=2607782 RepID=UPI00142B1F6A|nr:DUF4326 domain-containing protein [Okeania sp. SIO2B9]NES91364.1 DUF4326 domain-containing protein [Okeania sp. SIO2B9]